MSNSTAWFIDGSFLYKECQGLHRDNRLDYLLLHRHLEHKFEVRIAGMSTTSTRIPIPWARTNSFH